MRAGQKHNKTNGYGEASHPTPLEGQLQKAMYEKSAPGMVLNGSYTAKDKEGNPYPPGRGPFPPGSEDNFDPNIKLEADGTIRHKTDEEKRQTKIITTARDSRTAMLKIYTDGSSLSNGQAGARAGVGVFFGPGDAKYASPLSPSPSPNSPRRRTQTVYTIDWHERLRDTSSSPPPRKKPWLTTRHPRNVSEALKGSRQTNQRAELTAVSRALDIAPRHRQVTIYTDSKYAIDCVTNWYVKWRQNGWVNAKGKPVENQDLIRGVRDYIEEREMLGVGTWFVWVKGHANDEGNIAADKLAVDGAYMRREVEGDVEREGMEVDDEESPRERSRTATSAGNGDEDQEAEEAFKAMKRHMEKGNGDVDGEEE